MDQNHKGASERQTAGFKKGKSLADLDTLPDLDVCALDIVENIEASLKSFREIVFTLNGNEK